jgi:hypothetical protein
MSARVPDGEHPLLRADDGRRRARRRPCRPRPMPRRRPRPGHLRRKPRGRKPADRRSGVAGSPRRAPASPEIQPATPAIRRRPRTAPRRTPSPPDARADRDDQEDRHGRHRPSVEPAPASRTLVSHRPPRRRSRRSHALRSGRRPHQPPLGAARRPSSCVSLPTRPKVTISSIIPFAPGPGVPIERGGTMTCRP